MKPMIRIFSTLLCAVLIFSLLGCGQPSAQTPATTQPTTVTVPETTVPVETTQPVETEPPLDPILAARRDAAESYMREMATYLWRAEEDITYTRDSKILTDEDLASVSTTQTLKIKAGRLYRGVPYSYSGTSAWNFYDYASEADSKNIHSVSGLHWRALNGSQSIGARVGNDCSGAVQLAWDFIGGNFQAASTQYMVLDRGYLPVGEYESDPAENFKTTETCTKNGSAVMYAAYAQLQKADVVVYRTDSYGHAMMIVDVNVVYNDNGTINGNNSTVTALHQTSSYIKSQKYTYDETLGENVYMTFGIDDKFTFSELFLDGFLPVTCDALIDPAPVAEPSVTDSEQEHTFDTILTGVFTSNRMLSGAGITITDSNGSVVADAFCYNPRQTGKDDYTFDLAARFTGELEQVRWGELDLSALSAGTYHCTHTLRDAHGEEYIMRDFDFTVS